jgi:hypothetical protein
MSSNVDEREEDRALVGASSLDGPVFTPTCHPSA